jgi:hypothetical protein
MTILKDIKKEEQHTIHFAAKLRSSSAIKIFAVMCLLMAMNFLQAAPRLILRSGDGLEMISYSSAHDYIIPHTARAYYVTMDKYKKFWGYELYDPLVLFMEDFSDWSNGGTSPSPRNFIYLTLSPYFYVFEVTPGNERMSLLMHHELTHLVMTDMHNKSDRFWRKLFLGKVSPSAENPVSMLYGYLTTPRMYSPRWYHEGMAVTMETWMSGGIGRALSPYDEMVFRTKVMDDTYLYDLVGLESEGTAIDFQVGALSYLYGTRFYTWLSLQFGPEKLVDWTARRDGDPRWFMSQFRKVYGMPLTQAWDQWREFEKSWTEQNLQRVQKYPITKSRKITQQQLGSVSRTFYDKEKNALISAIRYPGQLPYLVSIDINTGEISKIAEVRGASTYYTASVAFDEAGRQIFMSEDNSNYRNLSVVNVDSGKKRHLMKDSRTGDLAFSQSDKILWGVRHENGISTIVRFKPPYTDWEAVCAFPYGTDVYDLEASPDGSFLTGAVTHIDGEQHLARFFVSSIENQRTAYDTLFNFGNSSPGNFVFSTEGTKLYGSSYYTGVSNLYVYDLTIDDMSITTNAETGFFRPVPMAGDSMAAFIYTAEGFSPVMLKKETLENVAAIKLLGQAVLDKHPIVKSWIPDTTPDKINLEERGVVISDYPHYRSIGLNSGYPIVEGYKTGVAAGWQFNFANHLSTDAIKMKLLVSPEPFSDAERFHGLLEWRHWSWTLFASRNRTDFYDLLGPSRSSRKGNAVGLRYQKHLIYESPRTMSLNISAANYTEMDELPGFQDVAVLRTSMAQASAVLSYTDIRRSQGAVDEEKGFRGELSLNHSMVDDDHYTAISANAVSGLLLPLDHSSVWLHLTAGTLAQKTLASDPFGNFYFGGFGNNWLDHRGVKQYHDVSSFPGAVINTLQGRHFTKAMGEWNLPPLRYRELGMPSAYIQWSKLSFFGGSLWLDPLHKTAHSQYYNAGLQIDTQLVLFTLFKGTLSAGYAQSYDENGKYHDKEVMVSLKIH